MVKTWKPTVAGILSIIVGFVGLIAGIVAIIVTGLYPWSMWGYSLELEIAPLVGAGVAITIILGIVTIVGGAFAIRRRIWGLALAGAICAFLSPPLAPIGAVLGVLAIIFVVLGKREFA